MNTPPFGDISEDEVYERQYPFILRRHISNHPHPADYDKYSVVAGFETFEEAWAAGCFLTRLAAWETGEFLDEGAVSPGFSVWERLDDIFRYRSDCSELKDLVSAMVDGLLSARKVLDDTNARWMSIPF